MNTPDIKMLHIVADFVDGRAGCLMFSSFDAAMHRYESLVHNTKNRVVLFPMEVEGGFHKTEAYKKAFAKAMNSDYVAHAERAELFTFTNAQVTVNALAHFTTRELLEELLERQMP